MHRRQVLVYFAVLALTGCASMPMASLEADAAAKLFEAPADKAQIYLYRNEYFGGAIPMTVSLDGRVMGRTGPQTYFLWEVEPGRHEIASHAEDVARLVLETQAGHSYYVWQEIKMGMWQARSQLHEVDAVTGQAGVLECKRLAEGG